MMRNTILYLLIAFGGWTAACVASPPAGVPVGVLPLHADLRAHAVPPPPDAEQSGRELDEIVALQRSRDSDFPRQWHSWHAGPPSLVWQKKADELFDEKTQYWARTNAYLHVAIYDALLAAQVAREQYRRTSPSLNSAAVRTLVPATGGYSYPCDHSVAAGAAATVLGSLFPDSKDALMEQARGLADLRIASGLQYRSDTEAGLALGAAIARQVLDRAAGDGFERLYAGKIPTGRQYYTGKPLTREYFALRPWALESPSQFRSPPPPDFEQDMALLRAFQSDDSSRYRSLRWEYSWPWGELMDQKVLEYGLAAAPLQAAHAYAVVAVSDHDNQVAHWDGKYTYFRARPDQYDPAFKPLFPTPPSPSYPAGHGTMAFTRATVMSYLFPYDRELFFALAKEANDSRFEGGVHYRSDNEAGEILGRRVGEEVVAWARQRTAPAAE